MSKLKTVHIVVFGIGNVGSTLINQINEVKASLYNKQNIELKVPIVANSKLAFYHDESSSNIWECDFETGFTPYKIEDIISFVKQKEFENVIAIDVTSSTSFVENYMTLIENGFHIVSANKVANTMHYEFYENLRLALQKHNKSFLYETNVGAGLPILETIKNLYDSGEEIEKIRGVFSGSLSYIFNKFSSENLPFSKILNEATNLGLTEPDARDDLSGKDVARKLLILSRELGFKFELNDVEVDSLVPKYLNGKTTLHQFKIRSKELDAPFSHRKENLPKNKVLRYVGELDVIKKSLDVKLEVEDRNSALGQLKGADSAFEVFTKSYGKNPLVIQGAGAGKDVTARGLLCDIIKLSRQLN